MTEGKKIVTQREIVEEAWQRINKEVSKDNCDRLCTIFKNVLADMIVRADVVTLRGLGMFRKKKRAAKVYRGRHFKTKEMMTLHIPEKIAVSFRVSPKIKQRLNEK